MAGEVAREGIGWHAGVGPGRIGHPAAVLGVASGAEAAVAAFGGGTREDDHLDLGVVSHRLHRVVEREDQLAVDELDFFLGHLRLASSASLLLAVGRGAVMFIILIVLLVVLVL